MGGLIVATMPSTIAMPVRLSVGDTVLMETTIDVPLTTVAHDKGLTIEPDVSALHDALMAMVDDLAEALAQGALS